MPKGGEQLPYMEVKIIKDWINMQPPQEGMAAHGDHEDDHHENDDGDNGHEDDHHEDDDGDNGHEDDHHEE